MDKRMVLGSLAMDLKRAAIGFHRGSNVMAERFLDEAWNRKKEYTKNDLKPYIRQILENIKELKMMPKAEIAEKALMYSTLIQNYLLSE